MIPRDWALRILEIDDLAPAERAEVDRFLASNEEARRLLDRVRAIESQSGPRGEISPIEFHRLDWESPRDRMQADESLRLLLDRLAAARGAREGSRAAASPEKESIWGRWFRAIAGPVLVPAGVGALALLFWRLGPSTDIQAPPTPQGSPPTAPAPQPADPGPPGSLDAPGGPFGIRSFTIGSRSGFRGAQETAWRTGDAFVLRTELEQEGNLFLVHVDPHGEVDLLYPADDSEARRIFPAGAAIEFPPKGSTQEWVFEGDPGPESFLLAVAPPGVVDVRTVEVVSGQARAPGASRDAIVAGVVKALETHVGSVRSLAIDHRAPESAER